MHKRAGYDNLVISEPLDEFGDFTIADSVDADKDTPKLGELRFYDGVVETWNGTGWVSVEWIITDAKPIQHETCPPLPDPEPIQPKSENKFDKIKKMFR